MSSRQVMFAIAGIALLLLAGVLTACSTEQPREAIPGGIQVSLLVAPPSSALPAGSPLNVRSLTESESPISHVELWGMQLPTTTQSILIRSDAAPLSQTTYTAMQRITPLQPGSYILKVIAYNQVGQRAESDPINFAVE